MSERKILLASVSKITKKKRNRMKRQATEENIRKGKVNSIDNDRMYDRRSSLKLMTNETENV